MPSFQYANYPSEIINNSRVQGEQANLDPLYIEAFTDFGVAGCGIPTNLLNYPDGTPNNGYLFIMRVTGGIGQNTITVNSGSITDAVPADANAWAGVIQHDDGTYGTYTIRNPSGSTLTVYPALRKGVTNGVLCNLHNTVNSVHYTEAGYLALAEYIYNYVPFKAYRERFIDQWQESNTSGWTLVNGLAAGRVVYNVSGNGFLGFSGGGTRIRSNTWLQVYPLGTGANTGISRTVALNNKSGVLDISVAGSALQTCRALVTIDGNIMYDANILELTRITVPFTNANSLTVQLTGKDAESTNGFYVGAMTCWARPSNGYAQTLFPVGAKVVVLGDSWTRFYASALARKLQSLHKTGEVIDVGVAGQTAAWALANFDTLVATKTPDVVLIEFFVNDNAAGNDGGTYSTWKSNLAALVNKCKAIGAQPLILMPCPVAGAANCKDYLNMSSLMAEGS